MQLRLLLVLLFASPAMAGEVTLAWIPSVSPEVSGYKIYIGPASRNYSRSVDAGNVTIYKLVNLSEGTYFIAATAYSADEESDFSNEVVTTLRAQPFEIKTMAVSMRWFGVVLLCTTSENASAILRYTNLATGDRQTVIATPDLSRTQHRAVLYLNMGQQQFYRYEWEVVNRGADIKVLGGTFEVR